MAKKSDLTFVGFMKTVRSPPLGSSHQQKAIEKFETNEAIGTWLVIFLRTEISFIPCPYSVGEQQAKNLRAKLCKTLASETEGDYCTYTQLSNIQSNIGVHNQPENRNYT